MTVRYDDSLPCFVRQLVNIFGVDLIQRTVIVRDAGGRLSAVLPERITSERLNDDRDEHACLRAFLPLS